jgi:hypothetical protein
MERMSNKDFEVICMRVTYASGMWCVEEAVEAKLLWNAIPKTNESER